VDRLEVIARAIWCAHVVKGMSIPNIVRDTMEDGLDFEAVLNALNYGYYWHTMDHCRRAMRPVCGKQLHGDVW
jgi:hypothetical protein